MGCQDVPRIIPNTVVGSEMMLHTLKKKHYKEGSKKSAQHDIPSVMWSGFSANELPNGQVVNVAGTKPLTLNRVLGFRRNYAGTMRDSVEQDDIVILQEDVSIVQST